MRVKKRDLHKLTRDNAQPILKSIADQLKVLGFTIFSTSDYVIGMTPNTVLRCVLDIERNFILESAVLSLTRPIKGRMILKKAYANIFPHDADTKTVNTLLNEAIHAIGV